MSRRGDKRTVDSGRRNSYSYDDQTVENVRRELEATEAALALYESLDPEDPKDVALRVEAIARAFHAVHHLDRWLPQVHGWRCGYPWGSRDGENDGPYSVFSGHRTEDEAKAWLAYWQVEIPQRGADKWEITYGPTSILNFRDGGPPKR